MLPTTSRNTLSNVLEYNGELFLFDCGENTQIQIKKAKLSIGKISKIFISHFHGDHTNGLSGLLQTLSNTQDVTNVEIHGPKNTKKYIYHILNSSIFKPSYELKIFEHIPQKGEIKQIIKTGNYSINCAKLSHSVPCLGYSFIENDTINVYTEKLKEYKIDKDIEKILKLKHGQDIEINNEKVKNSKLTYLKKGIKVSFVFDTRPCKEISLLVKNSDYLIMEATFNYKQHFSKAQEFDHMSALETAQIANDNNIDNLIITHFSQRYKDIDELEEEAKEVFENTTSAFDLMKINLKNKKTN